MNKFFLVGLLVCWASHALAQMPASEELPMVAGTQSNSATTTLQDVAQQQPQITPPVVSTITVPDQAANIVASPLPTATSASGATSAPVAPASDIDAVINNVVSDTTDDNIALGAAPAAEIPVEAEPAQELEDDPMQPQKFAVLGTLDKVTGRTATLDVPVDKVVAVGPLFLQVKACQKASAFANQPENAAFVQVWQSDDSQKSQATSWVFSGWMFASSPALSAMDHPVYDVWVIDCKNAVRPVAAAAPDVAKAKALKAAPADKPTNDLSGKD